MDNSSSTHNCYLSPPFFTPWICSFLFASSNGGFCFKKIKTMKGYNLSLSLLSR